MTKIKPVGWKILVKPLEDKNASVGGLEIVNLTLAKGKVVEVSDHLKNIYKEGDVVLFPKGKGNEHPYNGVIHLFLDGQEVPQGDIWAIES